MSIWRKSKPTVDDVRRELSGRTKLVAVTGASNVLGTRPDVPAIAETVPGYEANVVYGIAMPKGTPPDVVAKFNAAVNAVLKNPKLQARIDELGASPMPMTPAEFKKLVVDQTDKWANVIKTAGIKIP